MNDPSLCHLRNQVRRITDAGFSLVLVCHPDRVEAVASPGETAASRGVGGRSSVVRYLDGGGPHAVAAAVSELADAVAAPAGAARLLPLPCTQGRGPG